MAKSTRPDTTWAQGGGGVAVGAGVLVGAEMDCFMDSFRIAWSDLLASGVLGKYSSSSSSSGQYSSGLPAFLRASSSQISNRSKLATSGTGSLLWIIPDPELSRR